MEAYTIIQLPKIFDERGNLTFLENNKQIPFEIKRVFWIYDVPGGAVRGGHAIEFLHELIIAVSGSFDVIVKKNTGDELKFSLNRSYHGLYLPPNTWRHMENFSTNSVSLHICSEYYNENTYVRSLETYQNLNI